jgi:hypothetical protein
MGVTFSHLNKGEFMTDYYNSLSVDQYEEDYNSTTEPVFDAPIVEGITYCLLPSLEGVVELGVGGTEEEAKRDYLIKLKGLVEELNNKRVCIEKDIVSLNFTTIGEC